ncbi:ABC-three component system middle component 4 [Psychromonas sp. SA13A]|uniref:ABC-three component system middle component 4 n=1 Tax=Psychromonas sp. SA13A TaxID=2686346 RepID=UPI00140BCD5C|nr:ABC-three component system middle component 4 [Psychromonas sp. SA13A]
MRLPFLDADDDLFINLSIVLLIITALGKTNRGALKVNNEMLHIFLYLVKNPIVLNKVLMILNKNTIQLNESDSYSISSISPNIDLLFDRNLIQSLLTILISKKLIEVIYKKNDGFFYIASEQGVLLTSKLQDEYLLDVSHRCEKLKGILSISKSLLNQSINNTLSKESY